MRRGRFKTRLVADWAKTLKTKSAQPDWWSRAAVISSFLSSVVIGGVGLAVTSSIQKAQIQSSKALGDAQIQIAKLKNDDDRRLQENKFASDMLQNLLSDEPRHRKFAVIMLRRTVEPSVYEELLSGVAVSDPAPDVRQAAIRQLGNSRNPNVATALNEIASDVSRPKEERQLADGAKTNVVVLGSLSEGTCSFFAASSDSHAYESRQNGGVFTDILVEGLNNDSVAGVDLESLGNFLLTKVPVHALIETGQTQHPVVNCEGADVKKTPLFTRPIAALTIGITKYQDANIPALRSPESNEAQMSSLLKQHNGDVQQLSGEQATRGGILRAASNLSAKCGAGMDCIVYFSGHGISRGNQGYLVAYDSRLSEDPTRTCVSIQQLMPILKQHMGNGARLILFFDMDTSDPNGVLR